MTSNNSDFQIVKNSLSALLALTNEQICEILLKVQQNILHNINEIIVENEKDLDNFRQNYNQEHPNYDRLKLNETRIKNIAEDILGVINFPFNTDNNIIKEYTTATQLNITQVSVPLGIIGVIYESRPNVTVDVFTLCFRSQNACILKGGKEAYNTNYILVKLIKEVLMEYNLENAILLLDADREEVMRLITANELINVCIPRGGKKLINFVRQNATVPIIETGAGIVHLYFAESGNIEIAKRVIFNSKTRRVSTCNSLDTLIVHESRLKDLPVIANELNTRNVQILADEKSFDILSTAKYPLLQIANNEDYNTEFLDYKIAIKTVSSVKEAIKHIIQYTSNHSECIISNNNQEIELFSKEVDSSVIYINTSTGFTDGAQFGLGSEIGISTQKLHARGPMGVEALRTIKYIVKTDGLIRN